MNLSLRLRSRVETPPGSGHWIETTRQQVMPAAETALLLCDVWDDHWCRSAARRCDALAQKMVPVVEAARACGVQIIHAPSECMDLYEDTSQRRLMREAPPTEPPAPREIVEPPLPIDDSDGGCDDQPQDPFRRAWTRQHAALAIAEGDGITDKGAEVYNLLHHRGIRTLLIMGVHTNMCVLKRSFAIRQMTRWGVPCILIRDLTDTMYNPRMRPFVSHDEGTELVVQHIEKYLAPTTTSEEVLRACGEAD
jgi:nicotinamidase-related amidase